MHTTCDRVRLCGSVHLGVVLLNDEQEQKIGVWVKLPAECYKLMEVPCSVGMCPMLQMPEQEKK